MIVDRMLNIASVGYLIVVSAMPLSFLGNTIILSIK